MNTALFGTLSDLNTEKNIQYNNKKDIFSVKENLWGKKPLGEKRVYTGEKGVLGSND